jgi:hypothetical protein
VESGELGAVDSDAGLVVPWAEVVSLGMERWSQEVVEAALGDEVGAGLPELVRLGRREVVLPRWVWAGLEALAASEGSSVDALLGRELRDVLSAHSEWLGRQVPGFGAALVWPERL